MNQQPEIDSEGATWITLQAAAALCGCGVQSMRNRVERGTVVARRDGAHWRVRSDSLAKKAPGRPRKIQQEV